MNRNINETFKEIVNIVTKIGEVDNKVIKDTENLNLILLNLKIQVAHLNEQGKVNGIQPIADYLERTIKSMHDNVQSLINTNRDSILSCLKELNEYITKKESEEIKND